MNEEHTERTTQLKVATLRLLLIIGAIGTVLQLWWWYTGELDALEFFWPAPAALGLGVLLELRWNVTIEGDTNV